jgi:hypothetical protein
MGGTVAYLVAIARPDQAAQKATSPSTGSKR